MKMWVSGIEGSAYNPHDKLVTFSDKNRLFVYKGPLKSLSAK
jgi:hypothetical protein